MIVLLTGSYSLGDTKKKRNLLARNLDGSFRTVLIDFLVAIRCALKFNEGAYHNGNKAAGFQCIHAPSLIGVERARPSFTFSYIGGICWKVNPMSAPTTSLISFLSFQRDVDSIHQLMELSCFVSDRLKTFRQRINWPGSSPTSASPFRNSTVGVRHFRQICRCL